MSRYELIEGKWKPNVKEREETTYTVEEDTTVVDVCRAFGISHTEILIEANPDVFTSDEEGRTDRGDALAKGTVLKIPALTLKLPCATRSPGDAPQVFQLRPADQRIVLNDAYARHLAMDLAHAAYLAVEDPAWTTKAWHWLEHKASWTQQRDKIGGYVVAGIGGAATGAVSVASLAVAIAFPPAGVPIAVTVGLTVAGILAMSGKEGLSKIWAEIDHQLHRKSALDYYKSRELLRIVDHHRADVDPDEEPDSFFDKSYAQGLACKSEFILRRSVVHLRKARNLADGEFEGKNRVQLLLNHDGQFESCDDAIDVAKYGFRFLHETDKFKNYLLPSLSFAYFFLDAHRALLNHWKDRYQVLEVPLVEFMRRGDHSLCKYGDEFAYHGAQRRCVLEAGDQRKRLERLDAYAGSSANLKAFLSDVDEETEKRIRQLKREDDEGEGLVIADSEHLLRMFGDAATLFSASIRHNQHWSTFSGREPYALFKHQLMQRYDSPSLLKKIRHRFQNWDMARSKKEKTLQIIDEVHGVADFVAGVAFPIVDMAMAIHATKAALAGTGQVMKDGVKLTTEELYDKAKTLPVYDEIQEILKGKGAAQTASSFVIGKIFDTAEGEGYQPRAGLLREDQDRLDRSLERLKTIQDEGAEDPEEGAGPVGGPQGKQAKETAIKLENLLRKVAIHYINAHNSLETLQKHGSSEEGVLHLTRTCSDFHKFATLLYEFHHQFEKMERYLASLCTFVAHLTTHALELTALENAVKQKLDDTFRDYLVKGSWKQVHDRHTGCDEGQLCYGPRTEGGEAKAPLGVKGITKKHWAFIEDARVDDQGNLKVHVRLEPRRKSAIKGTVEVKVGEQTQKLSLWATKVASFEGVDTSGPIKIELNPLSGCQRSSSMPYEVELDPSAEPPLSEVHNSKSTVYVDAVSMQVDTVYVKLRMDPPRAGKGDRGGIIDKAQAKLSLVREKEGEDDEHLLELGVVSLWEDKEEKYQLRIPENFPAEGIHVLVEPISGCKLAEGNEQRAFRVPCEPSHKVCISDPAKIRYDGLHGVVEVPLKLDRRFGPSFFGRLWKDATSDELSRMHPTTRARVRVNVVDETVTDRTEVVASDLVEMHESGTARITLFQPARDLSLQLEPVYGCRVDPDPEKTTTFDLNKLEPGFPKVRFDGDLVSYVCGDKMTLLVPVGVAPRVGAKVQDVKAKAKEALRQFRQWAEEGRAELDPLAPKAKLDVHVVAEDGETKLATKRMEIHQDGIAGFTTTETEEWKKAKVVLEPVHHCMIGVGEGAPKIETPVGEATVPKARAKDLDYSYSDGKVVAEVYLDEVVAKKWLKKAFTKKINNSAEVRGVFCSDPEGTQPLRSIPTTRVRLHKNTTLSVEFTHPGFVDAFREHEAIYLRLDALEACEIHEDYKPLKLERSGYPQVTLGDPTWNLGKAVLNVPVILSEKIGKTGNIGPKAKISLEVLDQDGVPFDDEFEKEVSMHKDTVASFPLTRKTFAHQAHSVTLIEGSEHACFIEGEQTKEIPRDGIPKASLSEPTFDASKGQVVTEVTLSERLGGKIGPTAVVVVSVLNEGGGCLGDAFQKKITLHHDKTVGFPFTGEGFKAARTIALSDTEGCVIDTGSVEIDHSLVPKMSLKGVDYKGSDGTLRVALELDKRIGKGKASAAVEVLGERGEVLTEGSTSMHKDNVIKLPFTKPEWLHTAAKVRLKGDSLENCVPGETTELDVDYEQFSRAQIESPVKLAFKQRKIQVKVTLDKRFGKGAEVKAVATSRGDELATARKTMKSHHTLELSLPEPPTGDVVITLEPVSGCLLKDGKQEITIPSREFESWGKKGSATVTV